MCKMTKIETLHAVRNSASKVRTGHRVHGTPSQGSRSRSKSRGPARGSSGRRRASRSVDRNKPRKEYATPFDSKGRCHYHKNVQLAAKKQFGGGWKVLHSVCPKCMEDKFGATGYGGGGDDPSVRSGTSRMPSRSGGGNANGQFNKNGCCVLHTHIQVAKKRVFGSGWKVVRACPACEGSDVGADDYSVRSGRSARSNSSRKSTRSTKSAASRGRPGKATSSGRYGALPFDGDGYCCRHPNVQLAKKKALGGFKILHGVCPECAAEGSAPPGRRRPARRKSGTGRVFDSSGSETSSLKSGKSGKVGLAKRKRIRVRNLRTEDEDGRHGRYSGFVNDDHLPHGNGVMKYSDGIEWEGVWNEGSKAHGKTKNSGGCKRG